MTSRICGTVLTLSALTSNAAATGSSSSSEALRNMLTQKIHKHKHQLHKLESEMDVHKALEVVKAKGNASALMSLVQMNGNHHGKHLRHHKKGKLDLVSTERETADPADSVGKAVKMINEMIYKVQAAYDEELTKCCEYDRTQSSLMEETRQGISGDNARAAEARKEMLSAGASIQICEKAIPSLKDTLEELTRTCTSELATLDMNLKTVSSDVDAMSNVLKMVDCSGAGAASLLAYKCEDDCGTYTTFENAHKLPKRQQALAIKLLEGAMSAESDADEEKPGKEGPPMMDGAGFDMTTPAPRSMKRTGPCKVPSVMDPRSSKCSIARSPQCPKIQEKFEAIQTGFIEQQRSLELKRSTLAGECKKQKANLEAQISSYEVKLKQYNTALAAATATNSEALEASRLKNVQLQEFMQGYREMTDECHTNYDAMEAEECALTKIRGEVVTKIKGAGTLPVYQDCVVTDWAESNECTATCGGGTVEMVRSISTYPFKGAECPVLKEVLSCNIQKCPVDCKLADWSGWSSCSAECGGGVQERQRDILQEPLHNGEGCGETQEVVACNPESCDKDCTLTDWTAWSNCTKQCDWGHQSRFRTVNTPPEGEGHCPEKDGPERTQFISCNEQECPAPVGEVIKCKSKTDMVLLIDGSGSIGKTGWKASIAAATNLVSAMDLENSGSQMALIVYSGPKYGCPYYQCMGYADSWFFQTVCGDVTEPPDCGIYTIQHFTDQTADLLAALKEAEWPGRGTYTSIALHTAMSELSLGQDDANSVVVVMTDGHPADRASTLAASNDVKKKAHLVYVPITKYAPMKDIKQWATSEDSIVAVNSFDDLEDSKVLNRITASTCPEVVIPTAAPDAAAAKGK